MNTITEEMKSDFNDDFFLALKKYFPTAEGSLERETKTGHINLYSRYSGEAIEISSVLSTVDIKFSSKIFWGLGPDEDHNQYCWEISNIKTDMITRFRIHRNQIDEINGYFKETGKFEEFNTRNTYNKDEVFEYYIDAEKTLEILNTSEEVNDYYNGEYDCYNEDK